MARRLAHDPCLPHPRAHPHSRPVTHTPLQQVLRDAEGGMVAKYYILEAGLVDLSCRGEARVGRPWGQRALRRPPLPTHAQAQGAGRQARRGLPISAQPHPHPTPPRPAAPHATQCAGGSFGPDRELNDAVYGRGVDVHEVLACRVQPPPEFQTVYNLLNE